MSIKSLLLSVTSLLAAPISAALTQPPPVAERPTITVAMFEFGAVSVPVRGESRARGRYPDRYGGGGHDGYDNSAFVVALGTGASDLVTEKLVSSERFRVFERKQLEAVQREQALGHDSADAIARARYIVTGSVSQVGSNDKDMNAFLFGAAAAKLFHTPGAFALGALAGSRSQTTVKLTARVVDTRSGEIIGSFTGEGQSNKRTSVSGMGAGPDGFGSISSNSRNFRETAIGEATERAAAAIAENVIALRATALKP